LIIHYKRKILGNFLLRFLLAGSNFVNMSHQAAKITSKFLGQSCLIASNQCMYKFAKCKWAVTFTISCICCRLKWISDQNDFKLVWFVFPLFYSHYHQTETNWFNFFAGFPFFHTNSTWKWHGYIPIYNDRLPVIFISFFVILHDPTSCRALILIVLK